MAQPAALPAAPPALGPARQRERRHGGHRGAAVCARRGSQWQRLQGEPSWRWGRALLQAVSSAPARAGLRFLARPPPGPVPLGTANGAGWGSPGARVPSLERILEASAQCPHGKTGPARTCGLEVTPGRGPGTPTPCPCLGVLAPPRPESRAGVMEYCCCPRSPPSPTR